MQIGTRARFVLTICAGSFLLFLVQPMIARMALPRLGGAPSVWNSAMLVYQALLLGGYAYAHMLGRFPARRQALIHLGLFLAAAIFLPIGLAGWQPPADMEPALWVLWLLAASIGPLFFVVAAQAPLLQRWFALADGRDPYPLYAASNLGSFAGLLAYPLLVEPLLTLKAQSILWSLCYGALFFLVYASARQLPPDSPGEPVTDAAPEPPPGRGMMTHWLILAAVPSGLMLATSLYLTTDIVAMPLLWVLPLGLYLLSFSVAFAVRRGAADLCLTIAPLILLIGACIAFTGGVHFPVFIAIGILTVLFVVATALHARLYDLRPAPVHLTRFYLLMSVGGMLGGLFCALIAPLIFDWTYEYPILLAAAALLLPAREATLRLPRLLWEDPHRRVWLACVFLILGLILSMAGGGLLTAGDTPPLVKTISFVTIIALSILALGHRWLTAGMLIYLMLCLSGWEKLSQSASGMLTRSYFGVYGVANKGDTQRILFHGTTLHGVQNRTPGLETDPTSYYAPQSGVGLALRHAPDLFGPRARIDVVGLGAGTLACYTRPGQTWRFYEIDPAMAAIARNPADFTFLSRCQPRADIVIGDARMMLARQPAHGADIVVIDAFSSDSIPLHLLTREAFAIYARRLAPGGLLLIHISNRYLDLRPAIAAQARDSGWQARLRHYKPLKRDAARFYTASLWIALSHDPARLDRLAAFSKPGDWQLLHGRDDFRVWTDDHASILPVLKIRP
ncbi:fused MFS/spermidine synthase [Sphingobium sp. CR2-8]|uniref:fused MFS/spermidine synthase n=1 Tax=Sphingobium sp. CR2-8 TaxID=1306534 RepID=UPI002DB75246|nr:fused MFS/spermidine synthase [Sphingobium sp. CR2-8]MEC3910727.1 fused MFS/spermidine synthase [Sphingobium sp. CR2-8]